MSNSIHSLEILAEQLGKILQQQGIILTTAESCTGGQVAEIITSISGSSNWFDRGFVTYSNNAKQEMLNVKNKTLAQYGAVSENVAKEMAEGALKNSQAHLSLAVTGIAGPEGGTKEKPVGTVCFAWSMKQANNSYLTKTATKHFTGMRLQVRTLATYFVLQELLQFIDQNHQS